MIKSILTVVFSWLVSLGIYYELPIAYGVYWVVSFIVLILILIASLYMSVITDEVRTQIKGDLFSGKTAVQSILCTPAFLYASVTSNSWNTLGLYSVMLVCTVGLLFCILKKKTTEEV